MGNRERGQRVRYEGGGEGVGGWEDGRMGNREKGQRVRYEGGSEM